MWDTHTETRNNFIGRTSNSWNWICRLPYLFAYCSIAVLLAQYRRPRTKDSHSHATTRRTVQFLKLKIYVPIDMHAIRTYAMRIDVCVKATEREVEIRDRQKKWNTFWQKGFRHCSTTSLHAQHMYTDTHTLTHARNRQAKEMWWIQSLTLIGFFFCRHTHTRTKRRFFHLKKKDRKPMLKRGLTSISSLNTYQTAPRQPRPTPCDDFPVDNFIRKIPVYWWSIE